MKRGSSPGPQDSKPAVQCLQAPNAFLDNFIFIFFEKKSENSYKLYKYLQKKIIKNFPDTHESNWLSIAKGNISINIMPKEYRNTDHQMEGFILHTQLF